MPADPAAVCRLVGAQSKDERKAVAVVLDEFFELMPDGWRQARADAEIEQYNRGAGERDAKAAHEAERMRRHRERRKEMFERLRECGIVPKWDTSIEELQRMVNANNPPTGNAPETRTGEEQNGVATAIQNQNQNQNQKKVKSKSAAFAAPAWIPAESWAAYLEVRTKKRATSTPYALELAIKSLEDLRAAGSDPIACLNQSIVKGWLTFYPLKTQGNDHAKSNIHDERAATIASLTGRAPERRERILDPVGVD